MTRNQKIKTWGLIFLLSIFYFLFSPLASAHTFATDGDITVLLHTNPDDDPIVGQPAAVLFQISDSKQQFDSSLCDCSVAVSKSGQTIVSSQLLHVVGASVYDLTLPVTFPEKGVYQITVTGKPKTSAKFQNFQVEFDLRVDRDPGETPNPAQPESNSRFWLEILAGLVITGILIFAVIYFTRRK